MSKKVISLAERTGRNGRWMPVQMLREVLEKIESGTEEATQAVLILRAPGKRISFYAAQINATEVAGACIRGAAWADSWPDNEER